MNCTVWMGSGSMISLHIPGFVKIDLFVQKLIWGGGGHRPRAW
jgi:hypothetical protein